MKQTLFKPGNILKLKGFQDFSITYEKLFDADITSIPEGDLLLYLYTEEFPVPHNKSNDCHVFLHKGTIVYRITCYPQQEIEDQFDLVKEL